MSKKCPYCKDAKDFYISMNFNLECGYCGAVLANVEAEFKVAMANAASISVGNYEVTLKTEDN
ncbi:hypothetical protein M3906_000251 [Vibrio metschnikovii]|nr:hypothetical protein [Vibrio metschnikovii]